MSVAYYARGERALNTAFTNRRSMYIMILVASTSIRHSAYTTPKENTMDVSYLRTFAEILPNVIDFFVALAEYLEPLSSAA